LKKNLEKDKHLHKQDNVRIMRENVHLLKQINKVRIDVKKSSQALSKGRMRSMTHGASSMPVIKTASQIQ
jgi:hypothetical protein